MLDRSGLGLVLLGETASHPPYVALRLQAILGLGEVGELGRAAADRNAMGPSTFSGESPSGFFMPVERSDGQRTAPRLGGVELSGELAGC